MRAHLPSEIVWEVQKMGSRLRASDSEMRGRALSREVCPMMGLHPSPDLRFQY